MKLPLVALILFFTLAASASAQTIVSIRNGNVQGLSVRPSQRNSQPAGCTETRVYRVWVPAQRTVCVDANGFTTVRIHPGYYEYRQVQVWVPLVQQQQVQVANPVPSRPGYMHPMNTWRTRP
jgi:hypothetical protein